jgi:aminopeptidase N
MADADEKLSDATTDIAKTLKTTGEYDFPQTYSKVVVDQITDSALVRITHNWVAADSLAVAQPGLRISDSRYWTVEGIFPADFKAKGKFTYSRATTLDLTLITSSKDSLVMLYRADAGQPWRGTSFSRIGPWTAGIITVDTLQRGEYTLAVWDRLFLNQSENHGVKKGFMNIYPNPASHVVNIDFDAPDKTLLCVFDTLGKQVSKKKFEAGPNHFTWAKSGTTASVLYFNLTDLTGNILESRKVVFE